MAGFFATIQVVLQRPVGGGMVCEVFSAIAAPNPALISVVSCGGGQADANAVSAAAAISRALRDLSTAPSPPQAPCGPGSPGPVGCHAHGEPTCRRVLVAVGGTAPMADPFGAIAHWTRNLGAGDTTFTVIPVFPASLRSTAPGFLPASLSSVDIQFWEHTPAEVVPRVLSAAGITPADSRLFISYRHGEGQVMAEQLFDRMTHEHFDVFLDRFRIDAGNNFQERIDEELASKAMMLVLETPTITQSTWVDREIGYAVANRLGLLALHIPGGARLPAISNRRRLSLRAQEVNAQGLIVDAALRRVSDRIKILHARTIVRRRFQLQKAMRDALLASRVYNQRMRPDGVLEVAAGARYLIVTTPRPAELTDFQMLHGRGTSVSAYHAGLVSPGALLSSARRGQMRWLEDRTTIRYRDESEIPDVARSIAAGAAL